MTTRLFAACILLLSHSPFAYAVDVIELTALEKKKAAWVQKAIDELDVRCGTSQPCRNSYWAAIDVRNRERALYVDAKIRLDDAIVRNEPPPSLSEEIALMNLLDKAATPLIEGLNARYPIRTSGISGKKNSEPDKDTPTTCSPACSFWYLPYPLRTTAYIIRISKYLSLEPLVLNRYARCLYQASRAPHLQLH